MNESESEYVILVDEADNEMGVEEKMKAHEEGRLHRAFSIIILNSRKQLLLQQRAKTKYHCGGLWTNTCCSHPRPGEALEEAIHRRLKEEMGIDCPLKKALKFKYKTEFSNGLTEHEIDHVYTGRYDRNPIINKTEAEAFKWISIQDLKKDITLNPQKYTPWFIIILKHLEEKKILDKA